MCVLCRSFGKELDVLWHATHEGASESSAPVPARAKAVSQNATGEWEADGLISGYKWSGTVTYSFPDSRNDYAAGYGYGEPLNGFGQITAAQQSVVHKAMAQIEGFTNLNIEFAGENGADIRLARSAEANPTAYAYYPSGGGAGEGGDVWFGTSYNYGNPQLGNYSYLTQIHELGHSFGLKHAHENGGVAGSVPSRYDALEYTVMSYRSYVGGSTSGGYTNENYGYPQSFMMVDIAALQQMYGADFGFNDTDSTYSFSRTTGQMSINGDGQQTPGANRVFLTVWDGGGEDTYDFGSYANDVKIDLRPGFFSVTSSAQKAYLGDGEYAKGNLYNAFLFEDDARSYIENGKGGSGDDTLIGNAIANVLNGGAGADKMVGLEGNDNYYVNTAGDIVVESNGSGNDIVRSTITFRLASDQVRGDVEQLFLRGSAAIDGFGNGLNNRIIGNEAGNTLYGAGGNDRLLGAEGNDRLNGGAGNDTLNGGSGADVFVFDAAMGADTIEDFNAADGDVIEFDTSLFVDFADVLAHAAAAGSDVVITADASNVLTLESVALASLAADDFRFV